MNDKQVKYGVILSYLLIFLNTLFNLFVTPYMIGTIGEVEYGVYKTVSSLTSALMVIDLGLGNTVTRYVAKYISEKKEKQIPNFIALLLIQALIICAIIGTISVPIYLSIDKVYSKTFTFEQIHTAQQLFKLLIINLMIHITGNVLNGVITGHNQFLVGNGLKVFRLVIRSLLLIILLVYIKNSIVIVMVDIAVTVLVLLIELGYVLKKLRIRIRFTYWDNNVFREAGTYSVLMILQNIAIQLNGNVDTVLIGAMINTTSVTIYSMAIVIFGLYENLSTAISSVLLPNVVKLVVEQRKSEELQKYVEKTGRLQFIVLGAALGGFIVLGNDFYKLWLGDVYQDCYYLTLILIIPVTFPMLQSVALSILRAQNKMGYRTITLVISSIINITITVIGIKYYGYWGAAIGTAAYSLSNFIFMNIYYHRKLNFKIIPMLTTIIFKVGVCVVITSFITAVVRIVTGSSWISFAINAATYITIYSILLLLIGLNKNEKALIYKKIKGERR